MKRKFHTAAIMALTGLSCLAVGCKTDKKEPEASVAVQSARAQKMDLTRMVTAEAVVYPVAQAVITPKINAPVEKFLVTRGAAVRQGQLLAVLENRDLSAAAMDNKGTLDQAEATYKTTVGATQPEDAQKAELEAQNARHALDAQQKVFESREQLFNQGALPRKDYDQARVSLLQARSQYEIAKKHLDSLNALVKEQSLKSAGGQLASARGKYMGAQAQLSYTQIRSPINGVITDRPLYPGEMASSSAPLLTVMDISSIIAKAHIPEADAVLLHKGDKAVISVAGLEDIQGMVTVVSPALDPNSTTVEIWVQAKNPERKIRPGVTARIAITAQTVRDALVVPAVALLDAAEGTAQVMVIDSTGHAQKREVKTGFESGQQVQILSGIKAGEEVVTQGAYGLPDKVKVEVEAAQKEGGEKPSPGKGDMEKGQKEKD
ncbi:MAG TPA: efflux RND transporter periplasmic adaptor subunit [Candidatus Saccharimonadales bacterium]|nr:efflux RND transporter periplasmic adaptor subunit [Candidatus Saccharimonadales bacterium]